MRADPYLSVSLVAERVVREQGISTLPVDPIAIAKGLGILVKAKPASAKGVSGMLLRRGNVFGIAYATHIDNIGFQNFSVGHELGHYFLPGHVDAVLANGDVHESRAGFSSGDRYETEADHFAATLLMPHSLFTSAMRTAGDGLAAIQKLAKQCNTSLTATAIRYAKCTCDPVAIVVSAGTEIHYCAMSDALKDIKGLDWICRGDRLSSRTVTYAFNQNPRRVRGAERHGGDSDLQDWFGGDRCLSVTEEVVGLGSYGKTLTVLTALDINEQIEEMEEEEALHESWTPRFRRR